MKETLRFPLSPPEIDAFVRAALDEDRASNDITSIATVPSTRRARAMLRARCDGVIAGIPLAAATFRHCDTHVAIRVDANDGTRVGEGETVLFISGHARGMLAAERTALNALQRLSGVATLTSAYVNAVRGTNAVILDTRKTTPGWRALEKFAVRAGGGTNHRMDLASAVLIKDNHLAALEGDIRTAIERCRAIAPPGTPVEVECDRIEQVRSSLAAGADVILLDNMPLDEMREAVTLARGHALTEASGGVTLSTVRAIAETGVDRISVGGLTHSAPALNLALDFE